MKRLLLLAALALAVLGATPALADTHTANHRLGVPNLHPGSRGPDVADLQWLLSGHKPYAWKRIKPTLKTYDTGISGAAGSRTWNAVEKFKYIVGYPGKNQCTSKKIIPYNVHWNTDTVGPYFFALLLGHKQRPACWVALANKRAAIALAGATPNAVNLKNYELTQVGISEPYAYTRYNAYFGLPAEAWCAIFQGYSMRHIIAPLALLAPSNPWYVPNIITWGRYHGYLRKDAKVGEFVLYYGDISHIGYVIGVNTITGGYTTVEGNWNNKVAVVNHPRFDYLHYFLARPDLVK